MLSAHSYSGIPGSSALKGLGKDDRTAEGYKTSVVGLLYLGSFVLPLGQSVRGFMVEHEAMPEPYKTGVPGDYLPPVAAEFAPLIFNDIEDPEDVKKYHGMMSRHSSDSYNGQLSYEAWKYIPSVTLIPEKDMIVPTPLQEIMYEKAIVAGGKLTRVFVEGAGHSLVSTRGDVVASELIKLAGNQ